jgi:phosphoesterase RecJ-like protein
MSHDDSIKRIADKLLACRRVAVTSHLRPDGDSICTGLALARMLESLGKEAVVVNHDPTPAPFHAFPDADRIRIGQIAPRPLDAVVLLECADVARSGQEGLDGYFKINIDHHYSNTPYADINWIDAEAPAVGEMVFALGRALPLRIAPEVAGHLYCAIVSDTGSFQFSNTTGRALGACASLADLGASPIEVAERLYNTNSPEKIKLLARVLSTLALNPQGSVAVITMFKSDLAALGLREIDTEDITTLARSIKGVEIVLFFKEMDGGAFRVSLRSKGRANAARVAEHFGGGGHVHAAGFTVYGPHDRLVRDVPALVERLLAEDA